MLRARIDRINEQFGWTPKRDVPQAIEELWADPDVPQAMIDQYR